MIRIGDKVKSKNPEGSFQDQGVVVGLFHPEYFVQKFCTQDPDSTWSQKFPDWKNKPVVVVYFDEPQRTATLKEWIQSGVDQGYDPKNCQETYLKNCPVTNQTAFPHDDLEILL